MSAEPMMIPDVFRENYRIERYIDKRVEDQVEKVVAREMQHLATKEGLHVLREDIHVLRGEMQEGMHVLQEDMQVLRGDMHAMEERQDGRINLLDVKVDRLEKGMDNLNGRMDKQFYWILGGFLSLLLAYLFK